MSLVATINQCENVIIRRRDRWRMPHSVIRVFDNCRLSSHHELCHRSRGSTNCPGCATCRCVFPSFSVTARKEEAEGAETHEMDILRPHTSSVASSLRSVSTGQDIKDDAQSIVSQVEYVISIWPCCGISRRLFCSVTGSGGSDAPQMNTDWSRSSDDVSGTTSGRLTRAEVQIRAFCLTIVKISMT
jgi:hypothetical protein